MIANIGNPATEALAAARKALAEGEAIVAAARRDYKITRSRPGQLTRQFRPTPKPEPEGPDYFLSDREQDQARAAVTMLRLGRLMRGRATAYYRAAGRYLEALQRDRDRAEWLEIIHHEAGLRASRAYELMALARGDSTVAAQREAARNRKRKSRAKSSQRKSANRESASLSM
ncbi:MAG: hypothetical protein J2P55_00705 [Rhizobiales bacterium]|nr:hypothetical protein [Hyphomicrobiales bacterium]